MNYKAAGFRAILLLFILLAAPSYATPPSLYKEITKYRKMHALEAYVKEPRLTLAAKKLGDLIASDGPKSVPKDFIEPALKAQGYNWTEAQAFISFMPSNASNILLDFLSKPIAKAAILSPEKWEIGTAWVDGSRQAALRQAPNILVIILAKKSIAAIPNWRLETLRLVNKFRAEYGLKALVINDQLNKAAQAHADDMYVRDFFAHRSPSGSFHGQRASAFGYDWQLALENLATGQATPYEAVEGWKNSKTGHREAMLNTNIRDVGIGYRYAPIDKGKFTSHHYWAMTMALAR